MAGFTGRKIDFEWDGNAVAGVREKSVTLNGEPVDVSDGASNGWRELLAEAGENQVNISLSGVTKSDVLKQAWFDAEDRIKEASFTYPDGGVLSGDFYLASYNETGPYNDAVTFEAELQSSGPILFVPAS